MKKVLLYSGGMDSWLMNHLWEPDVRLYVDMNTQYSQDEIKRLPNDAVIERFDLLKWERHDKIIPLRNLYLVMVASYYGEHILIGATAGDRVLDKTVEFAEQASGLLSYLWQKQHWTNERKIKISVEFKGYTKTALLAEYLNQGGNIKKAFEESFSCYFPKQDGTPCWNCKPCARKYVAFKANGFDKNLMTLQQVEKFIDKSRYDEYNELMALKW